MIRQTSHVSTLKWYANVIHAYSCIYVTNRINPQRNFHLCWKIFIPFLVIITPKSFNITYYKISTMKPITNSMFNYDKNNHRILTNIFPVSNCIWSGDISSTQLIYYMYNIVKRISLPRKKKNLITPHEYRFLLHILPYLFQETSNLRLNFLYNLWNHIQENYKELF